jgi:hypothetical protein
MGKAFPEFHHKILCQNCYAYCVGAEEFVTGQKEGKRRVIKQTNFLAYGIAPYTKMITKIAEEYGYSLVNTTQTKILSDPRGDLFSGYSCRLRSLWNSI